MTDDGKLGKLQTHYPAVLDLKLSFEISPTAIFQPTFVGKEFSPFEFICPKVWQNPVRAGVQMRGIAGDDSTEDGRTR